MASISCKISAPGIRQSELIWLIREPCPAKPGDFFEFFAEIDLLCALSTCPGGDLSTWGWGTSAEGADDMLGCCRPLAVEVYRFTDPAVLEGWRPPAPAPYKGLHGIALPTFGA